MTLCTGTRRPAIRHLLKHYSRMSVVSASLKGAFLVEHRASPRTCGSLFIPESLSSNPGASCLALFVAVLRPRGKALLNLPAQSQKEAILRSPPCRLAHSAANSPCRLHVPFQETPVETRGLSLAGALRRSLAKRGLSASAR